MPEIHCTSFIPGLTPKIFTCSINMRKVLDATNVGVRSGNKAMFVHETA